MRFVLAVAGCLFFSTICYAQDFLKHVTFDVGAGFSVPAGQTREHTQTGFNFSASVGPRFNRRLSATLDFGLNYLDLKHTMKDPVTGADPSLGARMRLWNLTVNPRYAFIKQERFSAYVTGGYGLYNRRLLLVVELIPANTCDEFWNVCVNSLPERVSGSLNTYKGGYNAGGGVSFGTRTKFFVESRYQHMFTTVAPTEIVPLIFGVRW